ncbi:MAG: FHA domain-containing protein [Frankiaceae bacterium]
MSINERPEFASAVRGYDRQQVDDYVQVLLQYIDELNQRALSAEEKAAKLARQPKQEMSKPAQTPVQPPAERALHAVLAQVAEEARSMMEAARGQAEQVRAAARTDAAQSLAAARAEADQIVRAAHAQAGLVTGAAAGGPGPAGGGPPPPPPGRPPTEASLSYQNHAGRELVLSLSSGERFSIGRAPGSDIQLPWDDAVSRRHARIERSGDDWVVVDDGTSSNGTFVNEEQVSGKRRLRDGDVVRAGATRMTFHERVGGPQRTTSEASSDRLTLAP